jgi:hypothetical protein
MIPQLSSHYIFYPTIAKRCALLLLLLLLLVLLFFFFCKQLDRLSPFTVDYQMMNLSHFFK